MFNFIKRAAVVVSLAAVAPQAALAGNLDFILPTPTAELGPVSWTGFTLSPQVSQTTLHLGGSGSALLNNPKGFRAGLELDYDHQIENLVVGIAADSYYSWADGGSSVSGAGRYTSRQPYMGSLRGRAGVSHGRFLVYGTGGLALSRLRINDTITGASAARTSAGWAAGGGVQYAWSKTVTARIEYLHSNFGTADYGSLPLGQRRISSSVSPVTVHIALRF